MKKYILLLFLIVTFASDTAVAMADETGLYCRNDIIVAVVALVCVSMATVFLITLRRE